MNKKDFLTFIVLKLEKYFNALGFVYKSSYSGFVKQINDGWFAVSFEFYKSAGLDNFIVGVEIRKNTVQDILFKYVDIKPADQKKFPTFSFTLHKLFKEKENAYRFETEQELGELLDKNVIPFLETQLPYFVEKYSELKNLYLLFSDVSEANNRLVWPTYVNYINMLIMGCLLNPQKVTQSVEYCNELFLKLKQKWPEQLDVELYERDFNSIVQDLIKANGSYEKTGEHWSIHNKK